MHALLNKGRPSTHRAAILPIYTVYGGKHLTRIFPRRMIIDPSAIYTRLSPFSFLFLSSSLDPRAIGQSRARGARFPATLFCLYTSSLAY